jgi:hypothetical protein
VISRDLANDQAVKAKPLLDRWYKCAGLGADHLARYRASGFWDHDWLAQHDDSDPGGGLFLELIRRSGGSPAPGVHLELCVKSHGKWEIVDDDEMVLMPANVIRCRFDRNHEVFPSGFYDALWFRADDRGKLVEITRERFQLRNHSVGPRWGSPSRARSKVGHQSTAHQRGRGEATQSRGGPLAFARYYPRGTGRHYRVISKRRSWLAFPLRLRGRAVDLGDHGS